MESLRSKPDNTLNRQETRISIRLKAVLLMCAAALIALAACQGNSEKPTFESGIEYTIQNTLTLVKNLGNSEDACDIPAGNTITITYEYPNRNGIEDNKFQIKADSPECDEGWANYWDLLNASPSKSIASSSTN